MVNLHFNLVVFLNDTLKDTTVLSTEVRLRVFRNNISLRMPLVYICWHTFNNIIFVSSFLNFPPQDNRRLDNTFMGAAFTTTGVVFFKLSACVRTTFDTTYLAVSKLRAIFRVLLRNLLNSNIGINTKFGNRKPCSPRRLPHCSLIFIHPCQLWATIALGGFHHNRLKTICVVTKDSLSYVI